MMYMKTSIKIKQMKKKILLGAVASLFAVATVFNMGLLNFSSHSDATLEAITVMVEASGESYTNCINCKPVRIRCSNSGIITHRCELGGNGCDVGGQIPC